MAWLSLSSIPVRRPPIIDFIGFMKLFCCTEPLPKVANGFEPGGPIGSPGGKPRARAPVPESTPVDLGGWVGVLERDIFYFLRSFFDLDGLAKGTSLVLDLFHR